MSLAMLRLLSDGVSSLSIRTILVFLVVFLIIADYMKKKKPKTFPPGPFSLPFLGNILYMYFADPLRAIEKLSKIYGDIYSTDVAGKSYIAINNFEMVKEVLVKHGENFLDRPEVPFTAELFSQHGLISSNGHLWKQQRRFALTTLRNFGLGKKSLGERIQEECRYLTDAIGEEQGHPFDPHFKINNAVSNIICSITFGERFEYHNKRFQELLHLLDKVLGLQSHPVAQLCNNFPRIMKYIPGPHQAVPELGKQLKNFIRDIIAKHKEDWQPTESRDFIDSYLQEIAKDDGSECFSEENLVACTLDLFVAGTETTSTTLRWAMLYMAAYPDIQARVQAEIDAVVGQTRQPGLDDQACLPYTNAVVHELQRFSNVLPLGVPRLTTHDTLLRGFFVPKGAILIPHMTSVLMDKKEWETPDTFNPEHFLKDGQFRRREAFIPFSLGKRACPGEQLARAELFLFFTALLQKFTFRMPQDAVPNLRYRLAGSRQPWPYHICALPR